MTRNRAHFGAMDSWTYPRIDSHSQGHLHRAKAMGCQHQCVAAANVEALGHLDLPPALLLNPAAHDRGKRLCSEDTHSS